MQAKNQNFKYYIIKCTPQIRQAILCRDDKVHTLYSHCKVYDSYMPYQCYKCQEFGHSADNCRSNQVCPKCSGDHRANECHASVLKCNNCDKRGHTDTNHRTHDVNKCTVYKEEIIKAKNNTDHGVD